MKVLCEEDIVVLLNDKDRKFACSKQQETVYCGSWCPLFLYDEENKCVVLYCGCEPLLYRLGINDELLSLDKEISKILNDNLGIEGEPENERIITELAAEKLLVLVKREKMKSEKIGMNKW